jgi:hypothetical protein
VHVRVDDGRQRRGQRPALVVADRGQRDALAAPRPAEADAARDVRLADIWALDPRRCYRRRMMDRRPFASLLLGLLAACGGTAVVEVGAGGSGATASTQTVTATTTSNDSATTGVDRITQACADVCGAIEADGCPEPDCVAACVDAADGLCGREYLKLIECLTAATGTNLCEVFPTECQDELDALDACTGAGCPPDACGADDGGGCFCSGSCHGVPYDVSCGAAPDGTLQCTCTWDGEVLGVCTELDSCPNTRYPACCGTIFPFPE